LVEILSGFFDKLINSACAFVFRGFVHLLTSQAQDTGFDVPFGDKESDPLGFFSFNLSRLLPSFFKLLLSICDTSRICIDCGSTSLLRDSTRARIARRIHNPLVRSPNVCCAGYGRLASNSA
jgi:hypothetical protein